tara:strand:- start:416 stop:841 length:426 start_codon:yes stop_codon:yes gene_type:complete
MMEFWLVAKVWSAKTWAFIKKYWQLFAGAIYAIAVWVYFKGKVDNIKEVLRVEEDTHQQEIDAINSSHAEEIAQRDEALDKYQEIIAKIEKKYEERKEELSEEKRAEVNKLVSKYRNDPGTLSRLLSERFGIVHIEVMKND